MAEEKVEAPVETRPEIVLQIRLSQETGLTVTGPIDNEMLAIYMLNKAEDTVKQFNIQKMTPKIQKPGGMLGFARHVFRK